MGAENWTLDTLGNWPALAVGASQTYSQNVSRSHNAQNQITQIGTTTSAGTSTVSPTYDYNGNMLTDDNGITYTYDAWNRQITATLSGNASLQMQYTYDGLGRRITTMDGPKTGLGSPPVVLQINDGTLQASMVDSVTLEFQSAVTLTTGNLTLTNASGTAMIYNLVSSNGGKNWTLSFPSSLNSAYVGNSLPNGAYTLTVSVGSINQTFTFFRFYGDFNGDGVVNGTDFAIFAPYFGTQTNSSDWYLDCNDDGVINGTEFAEFSTNFGHQAPGSYTGPIVWNGVPPRDLYYSKDWQVLEEHVPNLTGGVLLEDQYVWGLAYVDEMVLRDRNSGNSTSGAYGISGSGLDERLYATQDANWNTTGLVKPGGIVAQDFLYDPYGNAAPVNANATASVTDGYDWMYLHQGGRLDSVTALYNFRHRDYSVTLGRWGEEDPAKYSDSLNLFLADNDNPVINLDPSGFTALVIDNPLGYWTRPDFSDLVKIANASGLFPAGNVLYLTGSSASKSVMMTQLGWVGQTDIWFIHTHGVNTSGDAPVSGLITGDGDDPSDVLWDTDIDKALKGNTKGGPGMVVLSGCESCSLAQNFFNGKAMFVVCMDKEVVDYQSATFSRTFLQNLFDPKCNSVQLAFDRAVASVPQLAGTARLKFGNGGRGGMKYTNNGFH